MRSTCLAVLFCMAVTNFAQGQSGPEGSEEYTTALAAYNACYLERLERLSKVCEPAESVAKAVVNGCEPQLLDFKVAAMRMLGADNGSRMESSLIETRQTQALTHIIEQRAETPC